MRTGRGGRSCLLALGLLLGARLPAGAANSVTLVSASGYGNFHAGGVVATVVGDDDRDASINLEWRPTAGTFRAGHSLLRIDATHFVGSLFWLSPATSYEARLTISDPDGVVGSPTSVVSLQTRADTLTAPTLRTLYVATTGNDGNPGTNPAAPLRHIQRAADLSLPGDLISIQPGVYRESVNMTHSGTANQPIVFRGAAPGVILDGADEAIAAGVPWNALGGGVYSRNPLGFATGHVVTEAGRLFRYGSLAALQALGAGAPGGFYFDGTTLYVRFPDNSAPSTHTMNVARFEDGFLVNGASHVRIENIEIRHFGSGDFGKGVYLRFASDCVVRTSKIHEIGAAGVWIKGGDRHRVEDNEIWDTSIFLWDWDLTKGSSAENDGVLFTDNVGRGNVVRRNTIHGTFNGVGACGSAPPGSAVSNETDIYDNVLYQHTDDALEPEGYCSNVRIWGNVLRDVHMGIAAAPAAPGPLFAVRNVAFRVGNTRTSLVDGYRASALKINSGSSTPVGPLLVYHNTFLTDVPNTDAVALLEPGTGTFIAAANNVLAGTRYALYKVNTSIAWLGNGDDLHTTDTTRLVFWQGTRYDTLAAFRAGVPGQEPQGISAPSLLVNPTGGDFTPQAGSALLDRAISIAGINDEYQGLAPDIGALERAAAIVSMSIADVAVTEGDTGATPTAVFTVSLSAASGQTVTVNYATATGTAVAGSDYVAGTGTIVFPPGVVSRPVNVTILGDALDEPDETFLVNLSGAVNATIVDGQGVGTIQDDDPAPVMAVDDGAVAEGNAGSLLCGFTVSLSAPSGRTITVNYATANGTATAGGDYNSASGGLTFTPGQVSKAVDVTVLGDTAVEGDEGFFVNLTGAVNATVGDGQGMGTILDDDAPSLSSTELVHGALEMADLAVDPGPTADVDLYRLAQDPRASYEVVVDATSGDVTPLLVERLASNNTTVLQTSTAVGTGSSRSLRWENVIPGKVTGQHIRVRSGGCTTDCGTDDVYRVRVYETTCSIPRFNNAGSQVTVLLLQNPTAYTISGHAYFWDGAGVLLYGHSFSLAPKALLGLSLAGIPALQGKGGTITVSNDGRYGDLTGKSVALEPATGFSFDSPMVPRPR